MNNAEGIISAPPAGGASPAGGVNVLKGLLWREWLSCRSLVIAALSVWLVCAWVLLIFFHPGFIIAFGALYAMLAGTLFGGADAAEGSEEFVFSLPPTRAQRYLVRLALGGGTVLVLTVLGVLAIALDLPQVLWGLVVESGFTRPFPACPHGFLYWLAVAAPLAVFAFSFSLAAVARSSGTARAAGLAGTLAAAATTGLSFVGEYLLWQTLNGFVSVPALLALSAAAMGLGYRAYLGKEGISRPVPLAGHKRWVWVIAAVIVLLVFTAFYWLRAGSMPRGPDRFDPPAAADDPAFRSRTLPATATTTTSGPATPPAATTRPASNEGRTNK